MMDDMKRKIGKEVHKIANIICYGTSGRRTLSSESGGIEYF